VFVYAWPSKALKWILELFVFDVRKNSITSQQRVILFFPSKYLLKDILSSFAVNSMFFLKNGLLS